jgi:hypothetical protein
MNRNNRNKRHFSGADAYDIENLCKGEEYEACGRVRLVLCGDRYGYCTGPSEHVCGSVMYHVMCADGIQFVFLLRIVK